MIYNISMSLIDRTSIQYIKGVGPAKKKLFANLGVETIGDLFYLFPRRYEDRRHLTSIKDIKMGDYQTVSARVLTQNARRSWYTKKHVYEVAVGDRTGRLTCVWFNQPYLAHYFKPGRQVVLYGKAEIYRDRIQMISPEYEILENNEDEQLSTGRIVPIYPLTRGMTQRYLRKVMAAALAAYQDRLEDVLPVVLRNKYRLLNIQHSVSAMHFPENMAQQEEGFRRISFEEFFLFQLSVKKRRVQIGGRPGCRHHVDPGLIDYFCRMFPFELTGAQRRVINEIAGDMQKDFPMLRLLQGDVGCGKTLVSLFGCMAAAVNGYQAAIMVPTEVLALQHYENIMRIKGLEDYRIKKERMTGLENVRIKGSKKGDTMTSCWENKDNPLPLQFSNPSILQSLNPVLLIGSMKKTDKEEVLEKIRSGEANLVVGTHALLTEAVTFKDLSFVVIDEQHKFGVRQRAVLSEKGRNPDVLVMTATPIPRTLSLTLFGDLDVSTIDEMPRDRGRIQTQVFSIDQADDVYQRIRSYLKQGQQAFVVYPVVQESEVLDVKAAEAMYEEFRKKVFKDFRVGLAHGQMKRSELNETMQRFKQHEIDLLVATTVLEVGVDVPNANVMVIEHAERFGLSQLHQLRGRIGRGQDDAVCFLLAEPVTEEALQRLEAISSTHDGFVLAEKDLEIRGPGHYFGRHQHGMNELRFANPLRQLDVLELARREAEDVIHRDPYLREPAHQILMRTIQQRYPGYLDHIEAG
jgi:ATP-dependent DNA helicase RecG